MVDPDDADDAMSVLIRTTEARETARKNTRLYTPGSSGNRILGKPEQTESSSLLAGEEVIIPSYTFVFTANAFAPQGAAPVFVDIRPDTLNTDESKMKAAITDRTNAIIPEHFAGVGCDMDTIMKIANRHQLRVIRY